MRTSLTEPTYTTAAFLRTASIKLRMLAAITWFVSMDITNKHTETSVRGMKLFLLILPPLHAVK
jgi:hypothetical protein